MKKILITLLLSSSSLCYAMQTVNFQTQSYTCNGKKITKTTSESTLLANCKGAKVRNASVVVGAPAQKNAGGGGNAVALPNEGGGDDGDDANMERVKFYADDGTFMKCFYKDGALFKCKAKVTKPAASASSN